MPSDKKAASIVLIQAIPKKEKMDYIAEKATELGVAVIVPLASERTLVKLDEDSKKMDLKLDGGIAMDLTLRSFSLKI